MADTRFTNDTVRVGDIVVIKAFDEVPEHRFIVQQVWDDCVGGRALDEPLYPEYGEPTYDQIKEVLTK